MTEVFMYGDWDPPVYLPSDAPLVSDQDADKAGWCKGCPLHNTAHVMIAADSPGVYSKLCPKPLLERGFMSLERQLGKNGYTPEDPHYMRVAAMLGLPSTADTHPAQEAV